MQLTCALLFTAVVLSLGLTACNKQPAIEEAKIQPSVIAQRLAAEFQSVLTETEQLAAATADLYARKESILPTIDRTKYVFAANGAFHKPVDDGGASLWISNVVPITPEVQEVAFFTEALDPALIRICKEMPVVAQVYFNDRHSLNRIYPWMDSLIQYEPMMNIPKFNFYYLADASHNPTRRGVWVAEPYVDPAGRGWMISAIAPVYHQDALEGVVGLDITLESILNRYIESTRAPLAIIAESGVIVAATEQAIAILEMPKLKNHKYLETVIQDTFKTDDYNIAKSRLRPVRALAAVLTQQSETDQPVRLAGQNYIARTARVDGLGWTVLVFDTP